MSLRTNRNLVPAHIVGEGEGESETGRGTRSASGLGRRVPAWLTAGVLLSWRAAAVSLRREKLVVYEFVAACTSCAGQPPIPRKTRRALGCRRMPAAKSLSSLFSNLVVRACQRAALPASFARVCAACCPPAADAICPPHLPLFAQARASAASISEPACKKCWPSSRFAAPLVGACLCTTLSPAMTELSNDGAANQTNPKP